MDGHLGTERTLGLLRATGVGVGEIVRRAERSDLLILGLQRLGRRRRLFGELTLHILRQTACPIILIGRGL